MTRLLDAALTASRAEVERLRAVPVVRTCGDCGHVSGDSQRERGGGWCAHPSRRPKPGGYPVNDEREPPSDCPLRKEPSHGR